jgi:hypothetical protein
MWNNKNKVRKSRRNPKGQLQQIPKRCSLETRYSEPTTIRHQPTSFGRASIWTPHIDCWRTPTTRRNTCTEKLEETVYEAFQSSRWYPLSYKKKIPKDLVPHLFQDVLEKLEETEFSFSEKFVVICDFVAIPYLKAYELIPVKYKEIIINELETRFSVLTKRKIKRLF